MLIILLSGFIPALITGRIFRELTLKTKGFTDSPSIYSADLAGSAFGFIFISGYCDTCIRDSGFGVFFGSIVFGGILFGTIRNKS